MAQKAAREDKMEPLSQTPMDVLAGASKQFDGFAKAQAELFSKLQESNRKWLERMQAEANLASECASKLATARSIPDAITACQEWTSRRMEMMAEDMTRLLEDVQKFLQTGAKGMGVSN